MQANARNPPPAQYGMGPNQRGYWIKEKLMGKGAFGSVVLWKNEHTGQQVCIKECHCMELNERQRSQWKKECSIMLKLKHPNVARGLQTPPELQSGNPDIPVLALEYCNGGDLRKVLNKAENCCGLRETKVRAIARDISLAVEYLHGKKIVHRDLKPENIVMKPMSDNKFQYKLIDLGYAKDVSAGSICKSFVGTEQYLAPELFTSCGPQGQHYNSNVDYWCLGTTVFEIIVGFRPFFHGIPAVQWLRHVGEKRPEQICGILNIDGDVVFSENIPTPNSLCRHSQQLFEQWLRLMLMYDANHRGGGHTDEGRPVCFHLLERILKGQILHIYNVVNNQVLSYPVEPDTPINKVMQTIQQEVRMPIQEQELLMSSGAMVDEDKLAVQCCGQPEEDNLIFLFPVTRCQFMYQKKPQPELVEFLISRSKGRQIPYDILKRAYSHCVHYVRELYRDYNRLSQAQRAANLHLMKKKSELTRARKDMLSIMMDLKSKIYFFRESIGLDLEKLDKQKKTGIYSQKMVTFWSKTLEQVSRYTQLDEDANSINSEIDKLEREILELSKFNQNSNHGNQQGETGVTQWEKRVMELYDKFRKAHKGDRSSAQAQDNSDIIKCVVDAMTENSRQVDVLYSNIQAIMNYKFAVALLMPRAVDLAARGRDAQDKVVTFQKQRQKDIWGLFSEVLKSVSGQGLDLTDSHPTTTAAPITMATTHNAMPPPMQFPMVTNQTSPNVTSSISNSSMLIEKSSEESMNLRSESLTNIQKLQETVSTIKDTFGIGTSKLPDWSFLDQEDSMMEGF